MWASVHSNFGSIACVEAAVLWHIAASGEVDGNSGKGSCRQIPGGFDSRVTTQPCPPFRKISSALVLVSTYPAASQLISDASKQIPSSLPI
jgi:hypothetical protein